MSEQLILALIRDINELQHDVNRLKATMATKNDLQLIQTKLQHVTTQVAENTEQSATYVILSSYLPGGQLERNGK